MSSVALESETTSTGNDRFPRTQWGMVVRAGQEGSPDAAEALEYLCQVYWSPLYSYLRRRGFAEPDAEDLVQGFFALLLQRQDIARMQREKGKFRTFLLKSLKHYLANDWDRSSAAKRGGGQKALSLDATDAEGRYCLEPASEDSPDRTYDRQWALTVLQTALERLRVDYSATERGALFEALKAFLTSDSEDGVYDSLAARLNLQEGAVAVAVCRMRARYREVVRTVVLETLADPAELADEMRALFIALQSAPADPDSGDREAS